MELKNKDFLLKGTQKFTGLNRDALAGNKMHKKAKQGLQPII